MTKRQATAAAWIGGALTIALLVACAVILVPRWAAVPESEATTTVGVEGLELWTGEASAPNAPERRTHSEPTEEPNSAAKAGTTRIRTYTPFDSDGRMRQDVRVDDRTDLPPMAADFQPSPSATSAGTYWLGTTADSASACWENPDDQATVVCLENPWSDETFTRSIDGGLSASAATSDPVLWAIELSDGSRWRLRTGGSWAGRPDGWLGAYLCIEHCQTFQDTDQVILSNDEYPHGYDDSAKVWTAFVGEVGTDDPPEPEAVSITEGWFVG